ncbi:hypothetical protein DSC45_02235 [Streptomyces sp. YIM 130001]|nr:hypothetical protein DSC45_02235 [Streptomyces sp. YIM 130001]
MAHHLAAPAGELTAMAGAGRRASVHANSDHPAEQPPWRRLTTQHADRLGAIMDAYGRPTADRAGEEAEPPG